MEPGDQAEDCRDERIRFAVAAMMDRCYVALAPPPIDDPDEVMA
jgi:hypothetical protein